MLQIFTAFLFLLLGGGALSLIATMLSDESDTILGALRGSLERVPASQEWPARVRLVSMPAPIAGLRMPQRARA